MKIIPKRKLLEHEKYIELLYNEFSILEKIDHPHIHKVYEILIDYKQIYVVTEFLEGGDLIQKLDKNAVYSESTIAKVTH